jgi:hypothetical protein
MMGLSERPTPFRDSSLFVVGLEGEVSGAEYQYFRRVTELDVLDHRRVRFVLLSTPVERHDSDPQAVLRRVQAYASQNELRSFDRVWLVMDVDTWGTRKLSDVAQQARSRGFSLAVSNPCFEVWLLLHHEAYDLGPILAATERQRSAVAKAIWRGDKIEVSGTTLLRAWENARALAAADGPHARWPSCPGSAVYRLFEDLVARQAWRAGVPASKR